MNYKCKSLEQLEKVLADIEVILYEIKCSLLLVKGNRYKLKHAKKEEKNG